jgi:hypothetical protein
MELYVSDHTLTLADMRQIIDYNKPFDTGYLLTFGNRYNENEHFQVAIYDLLTVPYIVYLEEGTQRSTKHQGFITQKTMNHLRSRNVDQQAMSDQTQKRSSQISQGVLEHIKGYGRAGGRYDIFIG